MLRHTQKVREKYEEIQRKIFYMIPEKWDKVCLYASVIDRLGSFQTGELFFYYIPKGIIKRKPVNVYEIPSRFNIDEKSYLKLVEMLYSNIKELRDEFRQTDQKLWSNLTIIIKGTKFRVEYNYDNLQDGKYTNNERHIIWKYKYLDQGIEACNKDERKILQEFQKQRSIINSDEAYESGIYIKNIKNIVDFETAGYESIQNAEYVVSKEEKQTTNQILYNK